MTAKKKRIPSTPTSASKKKPTPPLQPAAAPTPAPPTPQRYSALDAAAFVLRETGQPMSCPELIAQMAAKGYWNSPQGQTPSSTLYAAIAREIKRKGPASRFVQTGPGRFAARDGGHS
jgi:HB1, ASXL, restriction endonuclease HTH domain